MPSNLLSWKLIFERSKCELHHDISVTSIDDTLSYGFLHMVKNSTDQDLALMSTFLL